MSKQIVYCADGTWNNPSQDENDDHSVDPTNVYKLFVCLDGEPTADSMRAADEQEKFLIKDGVTLQAAKYIHGVGDSRNAIVKLLGGAFGAGVIKRVVRGYTFISRNYNPGDKIHIVGFSRGAYTARALAGLIASQGLLAKPLTTNQEKAYAKGAEAWYRYRRSSLAPKPSALAHLAEIVSNLPAFLSSDALTDQDLVAVNSIATVAVWDTVGAMGFPEFSDDMRCVDAFKFVDTKLSAKVGRGLHAIALDEERAVFMPTLWDTSEEVTQIVTQMLFPGAHSDVGGGYPMEEGESGLSDGALKWMMTHMRKNGVHFSDKLPITIAPNSKGTAHKPWKKPPFNIPTVVTGKRKFPTGMAMAPSIQERMDAGDVRSAPKEDPAPYKPNNLPE